MLCFVTSLCDVAAEKHICSDKINAEFHRTNSKGRNEEVSVRVFMHQVGHVHFTMISKSTL